MTRSMTGTRRALVLTAAAASAAVVLSGCSAGQIAETANKEPSVFGVNVESVDGSVLIRDLAVPFQGVRGYPAGATVPLKFALYNDTAQPVSVRISSPPPAAGSSELVVSARSVGLSGAANPSASTTGIPAEAEPSGSAEPADPATRGPGVAGNPGGEADPSAGAERPVATPTAVRTTPPAPPSGPAIITIPPLGSAVFQPGSDRTVQLVGLSGALRSGMSVNLLFEFSTGIEPLAVRAPVGVPLTPAPRGSAEHEGAEGGHGDNG